MRKIRRDASFTAIEFYINLISPTVFCGITSKVILKIFIETIRNIGHKKVYNFISKLAFKRDFDLMSEKI